MTFASALQMFFCNFSMNSAFYMLTPQRVHLGGEKALPKTKQRLEFIVIKTILAFAILHYKELELF